MNAPSSWKDEGNRKIRWRATTPQIDRLPLIELLPDAGRVNQAFGYRLPSAPSDLGASTAAFPGRLCIAANCFDAPAEVQASLGSTVSADYPGLPNGAITTAYLAAVSGSPDSATATRPSRIGQALLIEHPLAAETAVALIPFGCAATEEGCTTTDIVLDTIGLIPIFKPATTTIKVLKGFQPGCARAPA